MEPHFESTSRPFEVGGEITQGHLRLNLFGAFHLRQGEQPVAGFEHARLQHVLAYLALHRSAPLSRQQLAFLFWRDSTDQQALKNLRTLLTRLRQALPNLDHFMNITDHHIQWRPEAPFALDVAEFEAALAQEAAARQSGDDERMANALTATVELYTGDLLPGCYEDWVLPLRERFHQAYGSALERLVLLLEERREYSRALPYARLLLDHDPLREASYHCLIRLHLALGDRTEALRTCCACDAMLEREFGLASARGTRHVYERLLEADDQSALVPMQPSLGMRTSYLPLIGRKTEWSRLMTAWRTASTGHPQMVLLSGEAGIGKTRLAEELCSWVARQGVVVASAHCYPVGGVSIAYAPVVEWLHDKNLQDRLACLDDVWLVEVTRIHPSLLVNRPHLKSPGPLTESWQRTRLFEALSRAFLGSNAPAPLLLFLDDLQWCDQETLDWLSYLLRFTGSKSLLIVATVRKYEIDRLHPLMSFWLALTRSGLLSEVFLAPLDTTETRLLAASVAGRSVNSSEAERIYHDTEGNPLFVVEMMRATMANQGMGKPGILANAPGSEKSRGFLNGHLDFLPAASFLNLPAITALPPKVRAVIQLRLAQLSPVARALAQTAAVIGRNFSFDVLSRASGQDETAVIEGLDELNQRHLISARSNAGFDFTHDGIRTVAYDNIGPARKRAVHLRVAQILEELFHDDLDSHSIQIAGHYEQAGQPKPAIAFYHRSASAVERVYAHAAAARIYQHLLESDLSTDLPAPDKCAVKLALAEAWRATGQWAQAKTTARAALAEAEELGDARTAARARYVLAHVLYLMGYYDAALQLLSEAEQDFRMEGDWRGVAGALRIASEVHWLRGDHPQALALLERQREIAVDIQDPQVTCQALEAVGMVLWSQGDWERAADYCLQSIQIAGPLDYKPILTRASITLGNIRFGEHHFAEAVYWHLRAGVLAREMNDRQALSWAIFSIAQILAKRGDYERASAGYQRSLRIAWEVGDRWTVCLNVAGLAAVHERLGKAGEAEALYRQAIDIGLHLSIPSYLSGMLVSLSQLLLAQGRMEEARTVNEKAITQISGVVGERLAGEDTRFDAQVLSIHLRNALGELTNAEAAAHLRALLLRVDARSRQAVLYAELWRLLPEDDSTREAAAERYRIEYLETGAEESNRRYQELTGKRLPDPPPLPDVSDLIPDQREPLDLARMLTELKALLE